jgi:uncharacterized protein YqhQ
MTAASRLIQALTAFLIAGLGIGMILVGLSYPPAARLIPFIAGGTMAVLAAVQAVLILRTPLGTADGPDAEGDMGGLDMVTDPHLLKRCLTIIAASALILPLILLFGYAIATTAYVFLCLLFIARMKPLPVVAIAAANFLSVYVFLEYVAGVSSMEGLLMHF